MHSRSLSVCLLLFVGCGGEYAVAPVSGTVTFEGNPLAGASVTTQPISVGGNNPGPGSFATTDEQGRFELELVKPAMKGAIIGDHRVMISQPGGGKSSTQMNQGEDGEISWSDDPKAHLTGKADAKKWPARFTDGSLQLTVPPEGTSAANFDLSLKDAR